MIGKHKFRVGQKVRPSEEGILANIFPKSKESQQGVVTKVDPHNFPTVLWNGRKTTSGYHPDFIVPDRRRTGVKNG